MEFCSFASGSSGNCYLVKTEKTTLLIDVGIAGKRVIEGLESKRLTLNDVNGILITHEHIDHVKSLKMISKKAENAKVYASPGTLGKIEDKISLNKEVAIQGDGEFYIGDILVKPFHLSHDAVDPIGYSFCNGGKQITIVTDTGFISEEIFCHIEQSDLLVLEANHEVNILQYGSYPYSLKRRILGDEGHISNETAGKCICKFLQRCAPEKKPKVVLAHLSKENNTPKQAYLTIRNILFEEDFYIEQDLELDIITKDEISPFIRA